MDAARPSTAADITRSMQYMSARNGGLLVDFRPIRSYLEIAPGEDHYARVRTALDWIATGAGLGLLQPGRRRNAFARLADLARFAAELRRYEVAAAAHHIRAFERLGVLTAGGALDYRGIADALDAALPLRVVA